MKKGWIPALAVSAAVLVLLLMNTYGGHRMQTGLALETASAGEAWQSYSPRLSLPRGEYRVLIDGYGPVTVQNGEGRLLGAGNAGFSMAGRKECWSRWNWRLPGAGPFTATVFC